MRNFSKEEKEYIMTIIGAWKCYEWEKLLLNKLITNIFSRELVLYPPFPCFEIGEGEGNNKKDAQEYNNTIIKAYIPIAVFVTLLKYLNANGYIAIIPYAERGNEIINNEGTTGDGVLEDNNGQKAEPKKYFNIESEEFLNFLRDNYSNMIYPTQELIDYVENGYKTKEEHRFQIQVCISVVAIIVAIFISLF